MKKNKFLTIAFLFFVVISIGRAQVGINTENPRSTFEIRKIDNDNKPQGLLLPSLTNAEINAMQNPPESLMVYNSDEKCIYIYKTSAGSSGWQCVEFNKQTFAISFVGSSGAWVKNLETTDSNIVRFKVTNNLDIPINGLNLNSAVTFPNIPSGGYSITPVGGNNAYSSVNFPAGQSRELAYKITHFTPNFTGDLVVKFVALGREVLGNIIVQDESSAKAIQIIFNGNYIANKKLDASNTITLKVKNFDNTARNNVNLSNAINLNFPGGGINIESGQHTNVNIPQNGELTFVYKLTGTPLSEGTISAAFVPNDKVSGIVNSTQRVDNPAAGTLSATAIAIEGVYIQGTGVNNNNYVTVTLKNTNSFDLEHFDLSQALSFNTGSGILVVAGQHTDVSIGAGQTITLKYELNGTPSGSTIKATWDYLSFGMVSSTTVVKSQLRIFPDFIAASRADDTNTENVTVDAGGSNAWEIKNTASLPDWIIPSTSSGTGKSTLTFTLKPHTTSRVKVAEVIIERTFDGATGKVIISKPATNELRVSSIDGFSIHGGTKTITVAGDLTSTNINILEKPDWIETVKLNEPLGTLIFTFKNRTTPGPNINGGSLTFSYGPNFSYVYSSGNLYMKQKAELCADTPPLPNFVPYIRNKYKNFIPQEQFLLDTKSGFSKFETYSVSSELSRQVVHNGTTESYLYARFYAAGPYPAFWFKRFFVIYRFKTDFSAEDKQYFGIRYNIRGDDFMTYPYYIIKIDNNGKNIGTDYKASNLPASFIKGCLCVDGIDEDTPSHP